VIPKVNKDLCIGCGACEATCPKVFKVEDDGKSHVINPKGCENCDCQSACDNCPVSAITLEE
jgi:ferredoxin